MPVRRALIVTTLAAGLSIGGMEASAATLTNSFAAWQAGVAGAVVDTTVSTGITNANPFALSLPTTNVVPLADGLTVGLSALAQVTQPLNGSGGFPYRLAGGGTPDLLIPVDASGNQLQAETLTPGAGSIGALGFEVVPFSSSLNGPYTITVQLAGGQASTVSLPGGDFNTGTTTPGFFGFYGGGVSSLTITTSDPNGFAFGSFVDVAAVGVPEPASLALLLTGVIGVAGQARRRA